MVTKICFGGEGHVLSQKDCDFIANIMQQNVNLTAENVTLKQVNSKLKSRLKTKIYTINPYMVIIVDCENVTIIDASDGDTVYVRHL